MWIFVKDMRIIVAICKKEKMAKQIAQKIKGKGYQVILGDAILDPEDVWDLN